MSYRLPDFQAQAQQRYNAAVWIPTRAAEWTALIAGVAADTRKHDKTIEPALTALKIGLPQTPFTSEIAILINKGLAGGLTQSQMVAALSAITAAAAAPGNIDRPFISSNATPPILGSVLTTTNGNWTGSPGSFTYIWTRDQVTIAAATASTYTLVSADVGGQHEIRSVVSAVNGTGTTVGPNSNFIRVP
jgi:hypothetical protein